jgi:NitT/TauT family transport system substrate-binding protein
MRRIKCGRPQLAALAALTVALGVALACAPAGGRSPAPAAPAPAAQQPAAPAAQPPAAASAQQPAAPAAQPAAQQAPAAPAPEFAKLNLHLPSRSTSYLPWYVAIERGYFKEQNLEVEILQAPGSVGVKALVAGEMHFSGAASSAIPGIAQGAELKVLWVQSAKPNYWFTTRPEIRTLQDMKGKRIVVPSVGGGDAYTRLVSAAMRKQGMDPANDVIFIGGGSAGGGGSDILVGAMVAGVADGMVGNVLQRLAAEDQGFHTIHGFADDAADLQGSIVTTDQMLRNRSDVVRRFLAAGVKGIRVMEHDPDTSLDVLLKYVEMDREDAAKGLGYVRPLLARDALINATEQREGLNTLKEALPEIAHLEVPQVFDFAPLQEAIRTVDASGWRAR